MVGRHHGVVVADERQRRSETDGQPVLFRVGLVASMAPARLVWRFRRSRSALGLGGVLLVVAAVGTSLALDLVTYPPPRITLDRQEVPGWCWKLAVVFAASGLVLVVAGIARSTRVRIDATARLDPVDGVGLWIAGLLAFTVPMIVVSAAATQSEARGWPILFGVMVWASAIAAALFGD